MANVRVVAAKSNARMKFERVHASNSEQVSLIGRRVGGCAPLAFAYRAPNAALQSVNKVS